MGMDILTDFDMHLDDPPVTIEPNQRIKEKTKRLIMPDTKLTYIPIEEFEKRVDESRKSIYQPVLRKTCWKSFLAGMASIWDWHAIEYNDRACDRILEAASKLSMNEFYRHMNNYIAENIRRTIYNLRVDGKDDEAIVLDAKLTGMLERCGMELKDNYWEE